MSLVLIIAVIGCAQPAQNADTNAATPAPEPTAAAAPAPATAPAVTPATTPASEPVAATPALATAGANDLLNTTWKIDEYVITFKNAPVIHIKGGILGDTGMEGTYKFENGVVEVSALGQTKTGTWNGGKLVIDGVDGIKQ
ncbi:MAG: hypothetical protein HY706_04000 [Candidatus Hydrogenedentes bacterium]|nr:hypothetical protein [Candidatus Hydrogenedentota bacterium]